MSHAVFIGSSNSEAWTGWPATLSTRQGWTPHVYAVGGHGFGSSGPGQFVNQLGTAIADVSYDHADVSHVFITDASNDVRGGRPVAATAPVVFAQARAAYPNARIICVPVLWNHGQANVENLDRRLGVTQRVAEIQEAALPNGVEVAEWSWLWHWNSTEWDDGNHFTPAGYMRVVYFLERHLEGLSTDSPFPWTQVVTQHPQAIMWPTRVKREENDVQMVGSFKLEVDFGRYIDIGKIHPACIPVDKIQPPVVGANGATYTTTLYPDGSWRSWSALPAQTYFVNATFPTL